MDSPLGRAGRVYGLVCQERHCPAYAGQQRSFPRQGALKPGSPLLCGVYQGKLLICLSGNPFAALACFEVFAVPVLRRLAGEKHVELRRAQGVLEGDFPKESKGRRLIRARMEGERVTLTGDNHSSGSLATMIGCNCLIDIPAGTGPLHGGDRVEVILL